MRRFESCRGHPERTSQPRLTVWSAGFLRGAGPPLRPCRTPTRCGGRRAFLRLPGRFRSSRRRTGGAPRRRAAVRGKTGTGGGAPVRCGLPAVGLLLLVGSSAPEAFGPAPAAPDGGGSRAVPGPPARAALLPAAFPFCAVTPDGESAAPELAASGTPCSRAAEAWRGGGTGGAATARRGAPARCPTAASGERSASPPARGGLYDQPPSPRPPRGRGSSRRGVGSSSGPGVPL